MVSDKPFSPKHTLGDFIPSSLAGDGDGEAPLWMQVTLRPWGVVVGMLWPVGEVAVGTEPLTAIAHARGSLRLDPSPNVHLGTPPLQ